MWKIRRTEDRISLTCPSSYHLFSDIFEEKADYLLFSQSEEGLSTSGPGAESSLPSFSILVLGTVTRPHSLTGLASDFPQALLPGMCPWTTIMLLACLDKVWRDVWVSFCMQLTEQMEVSNPLPHPLVPPAPQKVACEAMQFSCGKWFLCPGLDSGTEVQTQLLSPVNAHTNAYSTFLFSWCVGLNLW